MPLASVTAANQSLNALDASGTPVNLMAYTFFCSASPSTTGANELSSVTRQASTWNAASSSAKTNSSAMTFTTPGSTAAAYFGTSSAVTAGTYGIGGQLASPVTAATITVAAGALTVTSA